MKELEFVKMHGAGNDFVMIDNMDGSLSLDEEQVQFICDRHFGIGADGLILVSKSDKEGVCAFMDYRNADGSIAQMCGNGVRCVAKFAHDYGYVTDGKTTIDIDTRAGIKTINLFIENGELTKARVNMGKPYFASKDLPTTLLENENGKILNRAVQTPYGNVEISCVSMGNPHAVIFLEGESATDITDMDINQIGSYLESSDYFPENCNIEFASVVGGPENKIIMRVFERGVGETLACGTGACATAVLAYETKRSKTPQLLSLLGGDLLIEYEPDKDVFMTGSAKEVFKGVINATI